MVGLALLFSSCTARHYRESADNQVYKIVQSVEQQIFGRTNRFSIDTDWSAQDPSFVSPESLIDSRARHGERALTIEDALDLAVAQSRTYQASKENLYLTALSLTGARHEFRPNFFASSGAGVTSGPDGARFGEVNTRVGVSQVLMSGGSLGLNLANDLLRYYTGDPRRSAVSTISVNLVQPILRGFGPNNAAVERLTQAERNVVYAVRTYSHFQDEFALGIVDGYLSLLALKDDIRNRYTNYLGRVQATKRLEARSHDRESLSDVDQTRQAELSSRNSYVNTIASYRNALDRFKIQLGMGLDERISIDDLPLRELAETGLIPTPLDPDEAYKFAVENHLPTLNAIDRFEDAKRAIRIAADRLKPGLDLLADASVGSDQPTDYTKFDLDRVRTSVGVELDLPLDRLSERNDYRATLVEFESELRALTLTLDELKSSIQGGLRTLEQRRQNYQIQTNALALANRRVASETMMLEAGRAEVRNLVESQDAQIAAQNAVTLAIVNYQQARLELLLNIGALEAEQPRFWLKDPLTERLRARAPETRTAGAETEPVLPPDAYFVN